MKNNISKYLNKEFEFKISHIDSLGNGVGSYSNENNNSTTFLIPGTLKDEIVLAKFAKIINGKVYFNLSKIIKPSNHRVKEDCKKFLFCGGCDFRHVNKTWLYNWKIETLEHKIKPLKIKNNILPITICGNFSRRRATFSGIYSDGTFLLGFSSKFTDQIVDIETCKILEKDLLNLYLFLKNKLGVLIKRNIKFKVQINLLEKGSDIVFFLQNASHEQTFKTDDLFSHLISANVLRVSFQEKDKMMTFPLGNEIRNKLGNLNNKPIYTFPPPGGFLQATKFGEAEIIRYVLKAIKGSKKVADLFCGSGTLSIPISQNAAMICADSNINSLIGLKKGLKFYNRINGNEIVHQNLLKYPLSKEILKEMDSIVINPPAKGAFRQVEEIIKTGVKIIVYVSCNINSFVRDAKIFFKNDYEIDWLKPIDQFPNTNHIEIVSKFNFTKK